MSTLLERRGRKSRLCSRNVIIPALRFVWAVIVIWCEFGVYFYSLSDCKWPDKAFTGKQPVSSLTSKPSHILLISDPQVRNPLTTSAKPWFGFSSPTTLLKKSWSVTSRLRPHAIIFLGDMLATGRQITSDDEYKQYYEDFSNIFSLDPPIPIYYIPGNNDIGLGVSPSLSKNARQHYSDHFGAFNQAVTIAGHRLILLDAPGLVEEDYRRHGLGKSYDEWNPLPGGAVQFVKSISDNQTAPSILFSHIPLSRPSSKSCGPLREKGTLRVGAGQGYQNMLGKQTTEFLLDTLHPSAVFSGDDRDYCDHTHVLRPWDGSTNHKAIREVTVKSYSLARNIRKPGFQLLSLINPELHPTLPLTFADAPCLLPDHRAIFNSIYLPCIILTIIALLYLNITPARHRRRFSSISPVSITPQPSRVVTPSRPDSAIWSAWSPNKNKDRTSPTSPFPPTLRVPNTTAPANLRAFSGPATPQDSPLLSPITLFTSEDDIDELMHPAQYAARRDSHAHAGAAVWSATTHDDVYSASSSSPFFLPPPSPQPHAGSRGWSWSRSFVLGGRRRRITIGIPSVLMPTSWRSGGGRLKMGDANLRGQQRRRGLLWRLAGDSVSVVLPAVIVGSLISWLML